MNRRNASTGIFAVDIRVCKPARRPKWVTFRGVLVDSGSEVSWLPEAELESAGIEVFKKDQVFLMANGQPRNAQRRHRRD